MSKIVFFKFVSFTLLFTLLVGCGTNPVTGERELSVMSTQQQIQMGQQYYESSKQSQGGEYYLDENLNIYVSEVMETLALATNSAFPRAPQLPYEIVVLNNDVPNAWALPGGKMAINRGLLTELEDESELAAVLGHEIVHAAAGHGAAQQSRSSILNAGLAILGAATSSSQYSDIIGYGSQMGSAAWMSSYGRNDELESDYYGMIIMSKAGYDPQGAVRLQQTFVEMSKGQNQDFISGLFASHPPSQARVDANRDHVTKLPAGGKVARERYQQAIAQLLKDADAYEAQDEAIKALNNEKPEAALKALDKAIKIQPDESQFWELRGYAWYMKGDNIKAEQAFSTAIKKNPDLAQHWVVRGNLRKEMGKNKQAEQDFAKANSILPGIAG